MTQVLERQKPVRGVVPVSGRELKLQRRLTVLMTVAPLGAFIWAVVALWGHGIAARDFWIMLGFYLFTGMGVSVGLHRYFTHKAFKAVKPLRWLLAVAGSMAVEGPLINWVAAHRRHHAYADAAGDPHSPHLVEKTGWRGAVEGLWHAHTGWLFDPEKTDHDQWAPDLVKDPMIARVNRQFPLWAVVTFALPGLIGWMVGGSVHALWTAYIWGSLVRVFMLHHFTWSINSICHFYGRRPFDVDDESRNVWSLSFFTFGEAWHNNHHSFPSSAFLGLKWWQFDPGGYAIRLLRLTGLARDVRRPTKTQMRDRRAA